MRSQDEVLQVGSRKRIGRILDITCGHTTDFYLGESTLPRKNVPTFALGKFKFLGSQTS